MNGNFFTRCQTTGSKSSKWTRSEWLKRLHQELSPSTPPQSVTNSKFQTEYEYRIYSVFNIWPNTNTEYIRFSNLTEYEYWIYSVCNIWPNMNTEYIRFSDLTEYEYWIYSVSLFDRIPNTEYWIMFTFH